MDAAVVSLDVSAVPAELAMAGVVAAVTSEGLPASDGSKIMIPPGSIVRLVFAGIADGLVKMSVPAETVVPPW